MRLLTYFGKTFRENVREWKILVLALVFGPFFIYMMSAYYGTATPSYALLVLDRDAPAALPDGRTLAAGAALRAKWAAAAYPDGKPVFKILAAADEASARKRLKDRDADLLIVIPADFSASLAAARGKSGAGISPLRSVGDASSVRFMVASSFADDITTTETAALAEWKLPAVVDFENLTAGKSPTEFDLYVPALLVLAVIMVLFTAAASIIKEVDKGTIVRLKMSRLSAFDFLAAVGLNQLLIGTAALGLTYAAALSVGYRGGGSAALFLAVGALATLSVIAIGLILAALLRTIFELLTVGVFPFFVLMFFSESMMPLPRVPLATLAGHVFYANDVLPTALAVKAFNKILNFGAGLGDILFEIAGIAVLTAIYFAIGLWLFRRRHLRPQ